MKTTRWIVAAAAIAVATGGLLVATAWSAEAPATSSAPPNKTVGTDDGTNNAKTDTASTKPAPSKPATTKPDTTPKPDDDDKNGDFKPSEEISEDMAVAYPTDI